MSLLNVTVVKAEIVGPGAATTNTYVTLKLQSVKSTTVPVKGRKPTWNQDFLFEVSDLDTGLLLEVWEKGMLWDKAIGYYWCPLNTIPFSKQEGPGTWWPLDAEVIMEDGRILETKTRTGHAVLVDCRFEYPADIEYSDPSGLQEKLERLNHMMSGPSGAAEMYNTDNRRMQYLTHSGYSEDSDYTSDVNFPVNGQFPNAATSQYLQVAQHLSGHLSPHLPQLAPLHTDHHQVDDMYVGYHHLHPPDYHQDDPLSYQDSYLDGGPFSAEESLLLKGCGSKRGSLGGASDIGLEDHLGYHPGEFVGGYPGPPGTGRGGQPVNTDQYYADQYDQYYRYGWDDPYEYDDGGAYEYEGWYQDPQTGEWKLDPAVREYYEKLGIAIPEPETDNTSSASNKESVKKGVDNSKQVTNDNKNVPKDSAVRDLNQKNRVSSVSSSDNYFIPYGDKSSDIINTSLQQSKDSLTKAGQGGAKDNATKKMHTFIQARPKPPDYDEAWYEDPTDGQWYNQYDWYEDETGEWAYDYRMEEYGYMQNELGEWVPMEDESLVTANGGDSCVPSLRKQSSKPGEDLEEKKGLSGSDAKKDPSSLDRVSSKDGFSSVFSKAKDSKSGSEKSLDKSSLPPRPPDFDDYWYQAEDGNWYNEYEDMGLQFADPNDSIVPNSKNTSSHKSPRPKDYDEQWYQDEFGVLRNKYDEQGLQFDDEDDFYTEEQLVKIEQKLKNESKQNQSKTEPKPTAVEPKQSVISEPSKFEPKLEEPKSVKIKPADFDDKWYQDPDGNWLNHYNKDGVHFEDAKPPASILSQARKEPPLNKTKQKVSFEKVEQPVKGRQTKSGRTPRERWLWAYTRIVQQNRVLKRLAKLETDRKVTVAKAQQEKDLVSENVTNNNINGQVKEIIPTTTTTNATIKTEIKQAEENDPFKLPMPGDYDDYWYNDGGEWYNEYDDELEEGYYYTKERKLPSWCTDNSLAIPKPSDYEDYWYEAEDGQWYNEYDDELLEGQYYVDKTDTTAANDAKIKEIERLAEEERRKVEETKRAEEQRKAEEARKKAEEEARKAKEAAEKAAKEAAKKAEEAAKKAQAEAKKMMQGFGGGLFGSSKPEEKKSGGLGIGSMFGDKKSPQPQQPPKSPQKQQQQQPPAVASAPVTQVKKPEPQPAKTEKLEQPKQQEAKSEPKKSKEEPEEYKGEPRPADFDDFWYEGEDGLWYNEYEDMLEEGQFYQEVPEEDGYPKPDLSEVPQDEPEPPKPEPTPAPAQPTPEKKQEAKQPQPTQQQKPPQAQPSPQQKPSPQQQQKQPQPSLGGMLGGMLGGAKPQQQGPRPQQPQQVQRPPGPQQAQRPPGPQQAQRPPGPQQVQRPPAPQQGQRPPGPQQGQRPPAPQQGQRPPAPQQGQRPPAPQQGQRPPVPQQGQRPPGPQQGQRPPGPQQGQRPPGPQQGQRPPGPQQGQRPPGPQQPGPRPAQPSVNGAKGPKGPPLRQASKPLVQEKGETEPMEKDSSEKRGVTFEDEVIEKKEREKIQVNKTRTMRPKEKWEWAFNKILKDIEVRRDGPVRKSRIRHLKLLQKHELHLLVQFKLEILELLY